MNALTTALDVDAGELLPELKAIHEGFHQNPGMHSPGYAPVFDPTSRTGLQSMLTAASVWLCEEERAE